MHLALAHGTCKSFRLYLYIMLNIFIFLSKCPLCVCHCCKTVAFRHFFFFLSCIFFLNTLLGLILTWNSLCLQSSMNLGCFEVIEERRGSTVWLNLPPLTPVGSEKRLSKGKKGKETPVNSWAEKLFYFPCNVAGQLLYYIEITTLQLICGSIILLCYRFPFLPRCS